MKKVSRRLLRKHGKIRVTKDNGYWGGSILTFKRSTKMDGTKYWSFNGPLYHNK